MNRIPCVLANAMTLPLMISVAFAVLAVGGGILLYSVKKRKCVDTPIGNVSGESGRERAGRKVCAKVLSDAEIARRLTGANRALLPVEIGDGFRFTSDWLYDELLMNELEGDNKKCDVFLEELIRVSDGVFSCAATAGDLFSRKKMHTRVELPDNGVIRLVKRRGLVRVEDGAVLMDAEVE